MRSKERKKETFLLTNKNMNEATKRLNKELEEYVRKEERLRLRLAFEDILDTWQRTLGEETACTIQYGKKRFGGWSMHLTAAGSMSDPNSDLLSTDLEIEGNAILQGLGISPLFEYKNGINHLTLSPPKEKPNQLFYLFGAAFIATILALCRLKAPGGFNLAFVDPIATILLDMLQGILSGVAMPMIFFSISISIVDMGNIAALGRIGKKFLTRFIAFAFVAPLLTVFCYLFTVTISAENTQIGQFETIFSMIVNIVPTNFISPFIEGNTLQIIFLGFGVGVAFLLLSGRMQTLTDCMKQLQSVTTVFMDGINRLLPLFVFLTVYSLIASGSVSKLGDVIQILVMTLVALFLMVVGTTIYFCLRLRVSARIVIQKLWP
ncbi:MAG: cation:dicarboxylase symporter family transporter, partial [Anaerovorax sp.]